MRASFRAVMVLLCGCAGVMAMACPPPGTIRVGQVDGTRVVRVTQRGKAIRKKIQQQSDQLADKLAKMQEGVKILAKQVEALARTLEKTDPRLKKRQAALLLATRQLRVTHLRYQKELNRQGERLLNDFKEQIRKVAMDIKSRLGLDLVIMTSRGEGLWIWPVKDITDDVVRRMDNDGE